MSTFIRNYFCRGLVIGGMALALGATAGVSARSQERAEHGQEDINRSQLAAFDQFLDSHPEIAKQLGANPSLLTNQEYLENHPDLRTFLSQHPELAEEIRENPAAFMQRAKQFDAREANRDRDRDEDRDRDRGRERDLTGQQVATFDQFLDSHPDIAKQLQANPSLVNNRDFIEDHPELKAFLAQHPELAEELRENPNLFMQRERQFDTREARRDRDRDFDRDRDRDRNFDPDQDRTRDRDRDRDFDPETQKQLQAMDQFLDKHKDIAKELRENPMLAKDDDFLRHHKSLQAFLRKHPDVDGQLKRDPRLFMQRMARLEHKENVRGHKPINPKEKTQLERKQELRPHR